MGNKSGGEKWEEGSGYRVENGLGLDGFTVEAVEGGVGDRTHGTEREG